MSEPSKPSGRDKFRSRDLFANVPPAPPATPVPAPTPAARLPNAAPNPSSAEPPNVPATIPQAPAARVICPSCYSSVLATDMFELDGKKMCGICTKTLSKRAVPGQRPTSSRSGTVPAKSAKPTGTFPASGLTTGLKPVIRTDEYTPFDRTMRGVAIAGIVLGVVALLFIFIFVSSDSYSERRVARAIGGCIILIVGGIWDLLRRRQRLALLRALKLEEKQDGKTAAGVVFLIRALSGFGVFFGALLLYAGMTETAEDAQEANARLAHIIIGILFLFPCLFFMVKRYNS